MSVRLPSVGMNHQKPLSQRKCFRCFHITTDINGARAPSVNRQRLSMRGIIFTELLDLIDGAFSEEILEEVLERCQLKSGGAYTTVGNYDYRELLQIVNHLSEITGVPGKQLVMTYCEVLFARFAELYPMFFEGMSEPFVFLKTVGDHIHVEVRKLYSDSQLPTVAANDTGDGELTVDYSSHRPLADVAEGLIRGCLKFFGGEFELTREDLPDDSNQINGCRARFIVRAGRG